MTAYFKNKNIVITGASSGIGRALALSLATEGVTLILTARRTDELKTVSSACAQKGAVCHSYFLDVADSNSVEQFAQQVLSKFQSLDILVNSAGISQRSLANETPLEVDRRIMEVNFFGTVHVTKLLFPLIEHSPNGQVVLLSSLTGTFGYPLRSAYAASKHAIEGFFESWRLENKNPAISFTVIAPGRIFTNISYSALTKTGAAHQQLDEGQANGISAEVCAEKIKRAIIKRKRKIYIIKNEWVVLVLHKFLPSLFETTIKKLNLK